MHIKRTDLTDTDIKLNISAAESYLAPIKAEVLKHFQKSLKLAGFREGKAPLNLVEKNVDQNQLQQTFLDEALTRLYGAAIDQEKLRPVARPDVNIVKFVPFTTLEFEATVPVVKHTKLADYKAVKVARKEAVVKDSDVTEVIESLRTRQADKKDVKRAAKNDDQVVIDFKGVDDKGEPIKGGEGKDYPIVLGSNTFIPGFEANIEGLKAGEEKTFKLTFPKDYGVKALAGRKVSFTVTVKSVQEVVKPKIDDHFASHAGPFKTLADLKADIKKQLKVERQKELDRAFENEIISQITKKSKIAIPQVLIDEQVDRHLQDLKQNLAYRGQTYAEFLEAEGMTEEKYRTEILNPQAEERVKAGLVLSKVAEAEKLEVTPEELEIRMQLLKGQYTDPAMQAELDKPSARHEITMRIMVEKSVARLVELATA